jgi:hypothetical protein
VKSDSFADKAIKYFSNLSPPENLPRGINVLNPYSNKNVTDVVKKFFKKFYDDKKKRIFVIGINPGRFGGGLTGISFTDPAALRKNCGIENDLGTRKELSSIFVYKVIEQFGGVENFFSKLFLTAIYPFAIIKDGKNYNYYDEKRLFESLESEIVKSVSAQIEFGAIKETAIILGKKNAKYFIPLNEEHNFFNNIVVLDHPRYIMQYRLKKIDDYISEYLRVISTQF